MGQLNKTTDKVNELLDKVEGMPEEVKDGKTPVLETGTTTTLDPGQEATSEVVANGTDESGNPKYKLNFGIPKGYDGAGGSGGGTADSVQWANVLNKPSWVNQPTKPTYTASEVGALPASTEIPSKVSQLDNDSGFLKKADFKTVNGQSIVGSGDIVIEGGGGSGTPSAGGNVNVTNGSSLNSTGYYAFKPSEDGSTEGTFTTIPNASSTADGLMSSGDKSKLDDMKPAWKVPVSVLSLMDESTSEEITTAFGMDSQELSTLIIYCASAITQEYNNTIPAKTFIGNRECLMSGNVADNVYTLDFNYVDAGKLKNISITYNNADQTFSCKLSEAGGGEDDTYYLPDAVYNLSAGDTIEEIKNAFGGDEGLEQLGTALKAKKKICIYYIASTVYAFYVPVYACKFLSTFFISFKFLFVKTYDVYIIIGGNNQGIKIIYPDGYTLNPEVYQLTSSSTSDEISTAVGGGEAGLKGIIQAVKDGNRLVIKGELDVLQINQDLMCNAYSENDNGDMNLFVYGYGYGLFAGFGGLLQIQYTKSSNTFSANLQKNN